MKTVKVKVDVETVSLEVYDKIYSALADYAREIGLEPKNGCIQDWKLSFVFEPYETQPNQPKV